MSLPSHFEGILSESSFINKQALITEMKSLGEKCLMGGEMENLENGVFGGGKSFTKWVFVSLTAIKASHFPVLVRILGLKANKRVYMIGLQHIFISD